MIYALSFNIDGVYGPGGHVHESLPEILGVAVPLAHVALDQLDDAVSGLEWHAISGEDSDPYQLLLSDDADEVHGVIRQISDTMKSKEMGHIDISEHESLFSLVRDRDILAWSSESFRVRFLALQDQYSALVSDLSDEWSET